MPICLKLESIEALKEEFLNLVRKKIINFQNIKNILTIIKHKINNFWYLIKSKIDIEFIECNAENLSFLKDESIDIYTISFGIRNCTNIDKVLKECFRVLKKGGRFMCLEFSHVEVPILKNIYDFYSFYMIPEMGGVLANDKESYQYLVESIRKFPNQETFKKMIEDAGFSAVSYKNLSGGICAIHSGIKI